MGGSFLAVFMRSRIDGRSLLVSRPVSGVLMVDDGGSVEPADRSGTARICLPTLVLCSDVSVLSEVSSFGRG